MNGLYFMVLSCFVDKSPTQKAVDGPGARASLAALAFARRHHQGVIDPQPQTFLRSTVEISLHRRVGRKVLRQLPPLAARRRYVEDRIHHLAKVGPPLAAHSNRLGHEGLDQPPLRICHVACVALHLSAILPTVISVHGMMTSFVGLATTKESQTTEITQPFFSQTLTEVTVFYGLAAYCSFLPEFYGLFHRRASR